MGVIRSDGISTQATGHKKHPSCINFNIPPPSPGSHQWLESYDIKTEMLVYTTLIQTSIFYPSLGPHPWYLTDLLAGRIPSRPQVSQVGGVPMLIPCPNFAVVHHWPAGRTLTGHPNSGRRPPTSISTVQRTIKLRLGLAR